MQYPEGLLLKGLIRSKKRDLMVEGFTIVREKRRRDIQGLYP